MQIYSVTALKPWFILCKKALHNRILSVFTFSTQIDRVQIWSVYAVIGSGKCYIKGIWMLHLSQLFWHAILLIFHCWSYYSMLRQLPRSYFDIGFGLCFEGIGRKEISPNICLLYKCHSSCDSHETFSCRYKVREQVNLTREGKWDIYR